MATDFMNRGVPAFGRAVLSSPLWTSPSEHYTFKERLKDELLYEWFDMDSLILQAFKLKLSDDARNQNDPKIQLAVKLDDFVSDVVEMDGVSSFYPPLSQ